MKSSSGRVESKRADEMWLEGSARKAHSELVMISFKVGLFYPSYK